MNILEKNITSTIPSWILHNNKVVDADLNIRDLEEDKLATKLYFKEYIDKKYLHFDSLEEKISYLAQEHDYWDKEFLNKYTIDEIKTVFKQAYSYKFKFPSFMSAFKFYNDYAMKSNDKQVILERYEDRLSMVALYHSDGDVKKALVLIDQLMKQNFTPATPTLLNSGKTRRGEYVSCFLLSINDSLTDIYRNVEFASQLSKKGGGISLNITALRARGETIKKVKGASSGVIPVMKLFEDTFNYVDQLGQRAGAGAAYLSVFHPDIEDFLGVKKINADEQVRMKTLSIGVIIPDKFIELAREDKDMYAFYPKEVFDEYNITYDEVTANMDYWYDILLKNNKLSRKKLNPRQLMTTIASVLGESGYPYLMFIDNVNKVNAHETKVKFSNLCSEILQPSIISSYHGYEEKEKDVIGLDISCNLASGNIVNMMENKEIKETIFASMDIMNSVSEKTNISEVPAVAKANRVMHSVGFGLMNMHGFLAKNFIPYGSPESIEFTDVFFNIVNYYSLQHSMLKAKETGSKFWGFENSTYADGTYFNNRGEIVPTSETIKPLFEGIYIPTDKDWRKLQRDVMKYGLYNSNRLAVAPNGSISYVMSATAGISPVKSAVEERTYNNSKTFYPMPYYETAGFLYSLESAYDIDKRKLIDLIATAQKHIDQGISLEICINSNLDTNDLNKIQLYAWKRGIKTLYYVRTNKLNEAEGCISCAV